MVRLTGSFVAFAVILSGVTLAAPAAAPEALKSPQGTRQLADAVMELVAADKIDAAFGKLKLHWPMPGNEIDTVILKTITARNTVAERFGATFGYAFVREDKVGDFLIRYIYAEKREHTTLRWVFYFYRPHSEWIVNGASWDDNVQGLF